MKLYAWNYMFLLALAPLTSAQETWTRRPALQGNTSLNSIHFVDSRKGFAIKTLNFSGGVNYGVVVRTTDAGATWSAPLTDSSYKLRDVRFSNPQTGYAVGHTGVILKTTTGGDTWTLWVNNLPKSDSMYLNYALPIDDSIVYLGGGIGSSPSLLKKGVILKSTDAGSTWNTQLNDTAFGRVDRLAFSTRNVGFSLGKDPGRRSILFKTLDGGMSWLPTSLSGTWGGEDTVTDITQLLSTLFVLSDSLLFVGGGAYHRTLFPAGGYTLYTLYGSTDGGSTWASKFTDTYVPANGPVDHHFIDLVFMDSLNGYSFGHRPGEVWKTTNAGMTWLNQLVVGQGGGVGGSAFNSVHFPTPDTGYVVGDSGVVFMHTPNPVAVRPGPVRPASTLTDLGNGRYGYALPTPARVQIRLLDSRGRLIMRIPASDKGAGYHTEILPLSPLPPGVFTLELKSGEKIQTLKIMRLGE